ncbi:hypothetical protein ACH4SP_11310 [Streptomyces sp. NPDC021093]|uniref:hypothetical protein n=1 Tax=Streptomyces sp. NPDC021093 TaxID=3365112 RepID=UPI00379AE435
MPLCEAGALVAEDCREDQDRHIVQVAASTAVMPEELTALVEQVELEVGRLSGGVPGRRAQAGPEAGGHRGHRGPRSRVRRGGEVAYVAVEKSPEDVAAGLGVTPDAAQELMARFGRWTMYR